MKKNALAISLKLMIILMKSAKGVQALKSQRMIKQNIFRNEINELKPVSEETSYFLSSFFGNKQDKPKQEEIVDLKNNVILYLDYRNYNQQMLIEFSLNKVMLLILPIFMTNNKYVYMLILTTLSVYQISNLIKIFIFFSKSILVISASVDYLFF